MRGKKKLVLGIAVMSTAGMLVFTATFPQQQIIQTEGMFQLTGNGTAGIVADAISNEQLDEFLTQAVTVEKHDSILVAASAAKKKLKEDKQKTEKKASKEKETNTKESDDSKKAKEKETDTKESDDSKKAKEKESDKNIKESDTKSADKNKDSDKKDLDKKTDLDEESSKTKSDNKSKDAEAKSTDKSKVSDKKILNKKNSEERSDEKEVNKKVSEKKDGKKSAEEKKWSKKLMADVEDYLNIRESANTESEVVGKLRAGDVATIVKKGKSWTKIESGSVKGYVSNKYCVYGTEAYKLANKICGTYATVQADGLRIRKKANTNATILEAAEEGDRLLVNTKAKDKDGWVTIKYNDEDAFVSEKYVDVALATGKAISIEEERQQIAAQQRAEAAQAAVSASSNSVSSAISAVQVSDSDLTLLSAIIYCEAGGESYAGQVAVGAVVMNRVKSSSYPNSISGVVYQSGQFSPVANGALARALSNGNYRNCISAAQEALAGADNTGGAKFFHRVNGDPGLVIGHHVFY